MINTKPPKKKSGKKKCACGSSKYRCIKCSRIKLVFLRSDQEYNNVFHSRWEDNNLTDIQIINKTKNHLKNNSEFQNALNNANYLDVYDKTTNTRISREKLRTFKNDLK